MTLGPSIYRGYLISFDLCILYWFILTIWISISRLLPVKAPFLMVNQRLPSKKNLAWRRWPSWSGPPRERRPRSSQPGGSWRTRCAPRHPLRCVPSPLTSSGTLGGKMCSRRERKGGKELCLFWKGVMIYNWCTFQIYVHLLEGKKYTVPMTMWYTWYTLPMTVWYTLDLHMSAL